MKIKIMFILGALICTSSAVLASSAPIIKTQPKSQTVNEGSSVTFSVVAEGGDSGGNADFSIPLSNSVNLDMVWIEPGTFIMGSPESEEGRGWDETQHQVTLTQGYWLGKYEVTQAQYKAIMGTNPSQFIGDNLPVEQIQWISCTNFCAKLTEIERKAGRLPSGYEYALPTEAQWEYACRAGTTGAYNVDGASLSDLAWYEENSNDTTHPVGQKLPNAWGLYDMHGNVYEWCMDYVGVYSTVPGTRIFRGGAYRNRMGEMNECRSANRCEGNWGIPDVGDGDSGYSAHGFRVALVPVQAQASVVADTLTYQWYKDGVAISGATGSSYTINSVKASDAGKYTVKVCNSAGCVTSSAATLTVNVPVTLSSITINGNSSVNVGSTTTYTCTATYSNGTTKTVTPTWAISAGSSYASITSGGVLTGKAAGTATIQARYGEGSVTKTVTKNVTVNAVVVKPSITTQPKSQTVYEGSSVTFSVTATGTAPLSYQWKKNGSNISGATKSSYTISSTKTGDAGSYTVTVSNSAGSVTSSAATLTVNTKPIGTGATINMVSYNTVTYGSSCGSLAGTKVGNEVWGALLYNGQVVAIEAFAVNSSGAPTGKLKGNVIGTDMVPVGTDVIFQLAAYDQGYIDHPNTGNYYYGISTPFTYHTGDSNNPMVLPDMYLIFNSFTIEWVTKPTITTQPKSQTVNEGSSATFSVTATGTAPLSYQWKKNGSNISGATGSSYTISSTKTSDAGSYTVTVSNSAGSVTSSAATLTVTAKPAITTQPKSQTVNEGSSVTFSVVATGSGLTYQWKKNGSNISGATKSSYTISSAKTSDAGSYTVTVSNSAGSVTSSVATLTVNKQVEPDGTAVRNIRVDGLTATVTLKLTPNDAVNVYFVEENIPAIGTIIPNDGGVYTPAKNVIRWSFLDNVPREVSYTVTVSSNLDEIVYVGGEVAFDTTIKSVTGDNELDFMIKTHPADTNEDFEISMLEISTYAVAWKQGKSWSREPADIPMSYVSRAALIWVNGGDYIYDANKSKPACWVNITARAASEDEPSVSTTERTVSMDEGKANVSIDIVPAEGISVYLVEEQLSADVTLNVTDISDGGNYIPEKNVIRWTFLDGTPRTLTYTLEPEEGFVGKVTLNGEVMFDEETFTIEGDTEAIFRPVVHFVMEDDGKTLILNFTGTLYESEDTVTWTEVEGAQSPFIVDTTKGKKFYRCAQ